MSKKDITPKSTANRKSGGAKNLKRSSASGQFEIVGRVNQGRISERSVVASEVFPKHGDGQDKWTAFDALTDEDIARTVAEDPDAAPIRGDEFWKNAKVVYPVPKQAISIRLDEDVLAYFKDQGPGYQSRINAVLRSYVDAKK